MAYDPKAVEPKWQKYWEDNQTFRVEMDKSKPKIYLLDMFPYPSGAGLHIGHPEGYTATDIIGRYKRMNGFNVMHPMGWDSFGLAAERYAVRTGIHPSVVTKQNIDTFRGQIKRLGLSYDWSRELATTDDNYVKWTQWIFLQLHKKGLAYEAEVAVNWCPAQGTVLSNEEVKDGKFIETGDPVERRLMKQWMLKITAYAERLLNDIDDVDWPEGIKAMQRNWIGKSEGAELSFNIDGSAESFQVFTTRPDTLWGATYCVIAPEHPLVGKITTPAQKSAVDTYVAKAKNVSDLNRTELNKEKSGVFTGAYAINPINGTKLPIWIADYVLMSYGTGAIMAVPAHDERDHDFAKAFNLPIIEVVAAPKGHDIQQKVWDGDGLMVNSDFVNGLPYEQAKKKVIAWLEEKKIGKGRIQYRLRDWLFSRQRYWGEPFPVLHLKDGTTVTLPEDSLPLTLPELEDYKPTADGDPPLARATAWMNTVDPVSGQPATRDANTMPQWAGSCWYYLRYLDPKNDKAFIDPEIEKYWMPVDLYVGGAEHAVLHLLYARFWHKVLFDLGLVSTKEPFQRLYNQGMILAHSYKDDAGKYYGPKEVTEKNGKHFVGDVAVNQQIEKMSKSKFNVVNPDEIIEEFGADSLRLYEMFMGPLDMVKPWQTNGVSGVRRFLNRAWRLLMKENEEGVDSYDAGRITEATPDEKTNIFLHKTIKGVGEDIDAMRFNTAISKLMELVNELTPLTTIPRSIIEPFTLLLAPFAPHVAEEMWSLLGHKQTLAYAPWPKFDAALASANNEQFEYPVQVNGKLRFKVMAAPGLDSGALLAVVKADDAVMQHLADKAILKEIAVPGRLVNFVVKA